MKILVMSDSHGSRDNVEKIIEMHKDASAVIILGDGVRDYENYEYIYDNLKFCYVSGNCDWYSEYPEECIEIFAGKRVFFSHGHKYGVKFGYSAIMERAESLNADICLFGHTHNKFYHYENDIHYFNPGAAVQGYFGLISIQNGDILISNGRV